MITDDAALRKLIGEPLPLVVSKIADRLYPETRPFIEKSPFVCVASADVEGRCDVSPRGDPPGFVRILDDQTLFVPERPGNKIADTLRNVIATGRVGLLFVIPGSQILVYPILAILMPSEQSAVDRPGYPGPTTA